MTRKDGEATLATGFKRLPRDVGTEDKEKKKSSSIKTALKNTNSDKNGWRGKTKKPLNQHHPDRISISHTFYPS
jgi:hypothetical protein